MNEKPPMPWDRKWHLEMGDEEYLDGILSVFSIFQTVHKNAGGDRVVAYAFDDEDAALIAAAPETAAERDRLKAINADLLAAAIRVRARCQSLRLEPDAASAMDSLESAIARAESGT